MGESAETLSVWRKSPSNPSRAMCFFPLAFSAMLGPSAAARGESAGWQRSALCRIQPQRPGNQRRPPADNNEETENAVQTARNSHQKSPAPHQLKQNFRPALVF